MQFQSAPYLCGPSTVVNVLAALGIRAREDLVAIDAGATAKDGVQEFGLKQSLERAGVVFTEISERKYSIAEQLLVDHMKVGPAIVLAEGGDHWVSAIGICGDRIIMFNSENKVWNRKVNGIHPVQIGEQLRRYWLPYQSKRYAILVSKP